MFEDLMNWFTEIFGEVALTFFAMLMDLFLFIVDSLFTAFSFLLDTLASSLEFMNPLQWMDLIPAETMNMMNLVGISEAMSIIISATSIKLILQIIPFIGLGRK